MFPMWNQSAQRSSKISAIKREAGFTSSIYPDMCCLHSDDKEHGTLYKKEEFTLYTKRCRIKFPYHGGMAG